MTTPLIDRVCGSNFSYQHLDAHGYAGLATVELFGGERAHHRRGMKSGRTR